MPTYNPFRVSFDSRIIVFYGTDMPSVHSSLWDLQSLLKFFSAKIIVGSSSEIPRSVRYLLCNPFKKL